MARKRMIDPEFWSDEEVGHWKFETRLFYIGLWNFADDEGRFKAHPALLKSQIFPYDLQINIEKLKNELNNKILWYEVNGFKYGYIRNFLKYQRIDRPMPSKLPPPQQFDESSTSPRRVLVPNIREVNINKDNIIEEKDFSFEEFWDLYPKKVGMSNALMTFNATVKNRQDFDDLKTALKNYLSSDTYKAGFVKNGDNWIEDWRGWLRMTPKGKPMMLPKSQPIKEPNPEERNKVAELIHKTVKEIQ